MFRQLGIPLRRVQVAPRARGFKTKSCTVPQPTAKVPDVETFLNKIGRNSVEHLELFSTWNDLFKMSSHEMKEKGIETSLRRYLLNWRHKFVVDNNVELEHVKLGRKKNGGERHRKEFLAKKRAAERN